MMWSTRRLTLRWTFFCAFGASPIAPSPVGGAGGGDEPDVDEAHLACTVVSLTDGC